jgi:hypothetical protein
MKTLHKIAWHHQIITLYKGDLKAEWLKWYSTCLASEVLSSNPSMNKIDDFSILIGSLESCIKFLGTQIPYMCPNNIMLS